jgi:hypothetical protein
VFEQQGTDEAGDRVFIGKDADDVGAPLDLAVEPLERRDFRSCALPRSSSLRGPSSLRRKRAIREFRRLA